MQLTTFILRMQTKNSLLHSDNKIERIFVIISSKNLKSKPSALKDLQSYLMSSFSQN
jgi:hypothetical protein